ncbi:MAG: hypothetical protein ACOY94_27965 [Bacillota bacterium]
MSHSETLLQAVEESIHYGQTVPGQMHDLRIPGIMGRQSRLSHPLLNLIGAARLSAENVDATISRVKERFARENRAFGWVTTPRSTPVDLNARLEAAGLTKVDEMAGMVLTDLSQPIAANPAVTVDEVSPAEMLDYSELFATAYGLPHDVTLQINLMMQNAEGIRFRYYVARVEESPDPISFGYMAYIPGEPVVLLGGAATLKEYRGKGTYSSLVARRLADARADGKQAAVIQAVRSTSAPICAKLGFREVVGLDFYAWIPPQA